MKNITINIKNDFFDPEAKLELNHGKKLSLVYGTNGSGKTTISKAFQCLKGEDPNFNGTISLIDESGHEIKLSDDQKSSIFIFNESFVDENIKEKITGLKSIVILGDNVDVDNKIDLLKNENDNLLKGIAEINITKYSTKKDPNCIEDKIDEIIKILKESYAERGRLIENRTNKLQVTEKTIDDIRTFKNSDDKISSTKLFEEKLTSLNKIRGKETPLPSYSAVLFEDADDKLVRLLNFEEDVVLKESISTRFAEIVEKYGYQSFNMVKNDIDQLGYCPICLRPFDDETKQIVKTIIDEIFDEKSKKIEESLRKTNNQLLEVPTIKKDDVYFTEIDNYLISSINSSINQYNKIISLYKKLIENKITNIKTSLKVKSLGLTVAKDILQDDINKLNKAIEEYNRAIEYFNQNKEELKKLNQKISFLDVEPQLKSLDNLIKRKISDEGLIKQKEDKINLNKQSILVLEQKKKNTRIAIQNINRNLRLIYSDSKRLKLSPDNNSEEYAVLSRGKRVKPSALSSGERNAIALCYFLESIKSNKDENSLISGENIVIIDDPVTSLDYDAKVGIFSFINKIINNFHLFDEANKSQIIILSHDYETIQKIVANQAKHNHNKIFVCKLQSSKTLEEIKDPLHYSNYSDLLFTVFSFANNINTNLKEAIVNITRKTLEAYSTFNYRKGFVDVLRSDRVAQMLDDNEAVLYYQNKNFNYLLNSGSHEQYQTNLIPDVFDKPFDETETQELLKDLLLFIYLTNKQHLLSNLEKGSNGSISCEELTIIFEEWLSNASWKDN